MARVPSQSDTCLKQNISFELAFMRSIWETAKIVDFPMFAGRDKKTESRSIHCSDVFSCADSRLFKIWDVLFRVGLDAKFEMFCWHAHVHMHRIQVRTSSDTL